MKEQLQKGSWYQAEAPNLIINVYLSTVTSFSEVWKWEIDFVNTDMALPDSTGWATSLEAAKKDALSHAELFAGRGNVGAYYKQKTLYSEDDVV